MLEDFLFLYRRCYVLWGVLRERVQPNFFASFGSRPKSHLKTLRQIVIY